MDTTISPSPGWRGALRPLLTARGYTGLTHHLLGLPLGVAHAPSSGGAPAEPQEAGTRSSLAAARIELV